MNIVIVGAGKVGETLCRDLTIEGSQISLIEINHNRIESMMEIADIKGIVGNGASYDIQRDAGVDEADIFIAVTNSDELNIIASIMAKKIGARYTIARVRSPEYAQNMGFVRDELGISLMINPELESSRRILDILKYPSAYNVESFMDDRVNIAEFKIGEKSPLVGMALKEIDSKNTKILICIVDRGGQVSIPNGNFVLQDGDLIHVTGSYQAINTFIEKFNYDSNQIKSCLIVGGGQMVYYLVDRLLKKKIRTKLIERDESRAREFSDKFPKLIVVNDDGTDHEVLREQRIESYDVLVAATGIDEENIILSMFANSLGLKKNITKVNRNILYPIAEKMDLDSLITPKKIIADVIIKFVRSLGESSSSKFINLHRLLDGQIEAIHLYMDEDYPALKSPLRDLELKDNTLIACIRRGEEIIYPGGNDRVLKGDHLLIVTKNSQIKNFSDILA